MHRGWLFLGSREGSHASSTCMPPSFCAENTHPSVNKTSQHALLQIQHRQLHLHFPFTSYIRSPAIPTQTSKCPVKGFRSTHTSPFPVAQSSFPSQAARSLSIRNEHGRTTISRWITRRLAQVRSSSSAGSRCES